MAHEINGRESFPIVERPWHEDAPPARKPRAKKDVPTFWHGYVQTFQAGPEQTRAGVSASIRGDTIPGLMMDAFRMGAYYLSLGYRVEIRYIERCCSECWGTGSITPQTGRGAFRAKTCPVCKGHAVFETMSDFPLVLPDGVKIVQG